MRHIVESTNKKSWVYIRYPGIYEKPCTEKEAKLGKTGHKIKTAQIKWVCEEYKTFGWWTGGYNRDGTWEGNCSKEIIACNFDDCWFYNISTVQKCKKHRYWKNFERIEDVRIIKH